MGLSSWQIWQWLFYLALCYFLRVGVCDRRDILQVYLPSRVSKRLITVFSRSLWEIVFGTPDISTLFLRLYCSPSAWFFSPVFFNTFYYCYITLAFLILHHNLVHPCKSFNFFTEFMQISILYDLGSLELSPTSLTNSMQILISLKYLYYFQPFWIIFWNVHIGKCFHKFSR